MSDDDSITTSERIPRLVADHRITVLVAATVMIALIFTGVGLLLYNTSGTAQIDLSRPDLVGVSEDIDQDNNAREEYPASGPINEATLDEFDKLYEQQIENIDSLDAFGGDPLVPSALGIEE